VGIGYEFTFLVCMSLGRVKRIFEVHKSLEAEERLNYLADLGIIFGSKDSKHHLDSLVNLIKGETKKSNQIEGKVNGKFVFGQTYEVV
jgi:hypothetical protein